MTDKPSSINDQGIFEPFHSDAVPWEEFVRGERFGMRFRRLGAFGGGSHVGVAIEELYPGKQSCPQHYHMLEEEHVLVLEGTVTVLPGDDSYEIGPGGYVCFPAGQKVGHALLNRTDAVCRYVVLGEDNPNDVVVYPNTGRVGVRLTGEGYRKSDPMPYWEGEPE